MKTITATIIDPVTTTLEDFAALLTAKDTVVIVGGHAFIPAQMPRSGAFERPRPPRDINAEYAVNRQSYKAWAAVLAAVRGTKGRHQEVPTAYPGQQTTTPKAAPVTLKASKVARSPINEYLDTRYRAMTTKYPAARKITRKEFMVWAQGALFAKLYAAFIASGRKSWLTPTAYLKDRLRDWRIDNLTWLTRADLRKQEAWALTHKLAER